jgi:lipopolysaccharide/colanic/teichoic acid biosynthesis glycosyltransferase
MIVEFSKVILPPGRDSLTITAHRGPPISRNKSPAAWEGKVSAGRAGASLSIPSATRTRDDLARLAPTLIHKAGYQPSNPALYRLWNLSAALLLIILASPLFAMIMCVLAITERRNIFYCGERLGKDRIPFRIYKFRTLRTVADGITPPEGLLGTTGLETRIGRYLRRTRLDELPQLVNVLKGDMNLMGPRPVRAATAEAFASQLPGYEIRFSVRPGLVGYTQALMTHDTPKEIRQRLNLLICRRPANIRLELLFLLQTALAMVGHTFSVAVRRLLQMRVGRYSERRQQPRVRPANGVVIVRRSGAVVGCGHIVDISESAFLFASPVPLEEGRFTFRLICPVSWHGRRSATCEGACREVRRRGGNSRRWNGDYSYLVHFRPSSHVSHYVIDRYFLRNSVVFNTGRLARALSAASAISLSTAAAGCAFMGVAACPAAAAETYVRPFGQQAAWNLPVSNIPRHAESSELSARLWHYAPARPGDFNLSFDEYTYPVYDAAEATAYYPIVTAWSGNLAGRTIPWSPAWQPGGGTDAQVIILDHARGREWNLWQAAFDGRVVRATNGNLVDGDFRTKIDGFTPSRGSGIQYLAMLARPQEIARGAIEHALSMPVRNIDGSSFVPPATKLERAHHQSGLPLGTRFALALASEELERWISSLPADLPSETQRSARIIARALRDYGWFITDTSGGAHLQFEARQSAGKRWAALGLDRRVIAGKEYPRDLLDGLVTPERIYALAPVSHHSSRR